MAASNTALQTYIVVLKAPMIANDVYDEPDSQRRNSRRSG
jgi:hypothetical protein